MNKERILGFDICCINEEELINNLFMDYEKNNQNMVVNVNPEIIINNYKEKKFVEKLNSQKYQIPDGIGIVYASKLKGGNIKNRITGIDFMNKIIEKSMNYGATIFLYGAKPEIAEKAKEQLEIKYPNIKIIGTCDGYKNENEVVEIIKKAKPDILFVGIGSPKQENFIFKYKEELESLKIIMPVGGSFDVISNTLKRAPNWVIKLNLEWLYRLIKQPVRIFRQVKLIKFIMYVIIENLKRKKM